MHNLSGGCDDSPPAQLPFPHFLLRWPGGQHMYRILVCCVDVCIGRRHCHLDRVLSFGRLDNAQVGTDRIIALYTPVKPRCLN